MYWEKYRELKVKKVDGGEEMIVTLEKDGSKIKLKRTQFDIASGERLANAELIFDTPPQIMAVLQKNLRELINNRSGFEDQIFEATNGVTELNAHIADVEDLIKDIESL